MRELDVFHREDSNKCLVKAQPLSFSSPVAAAPHPGKAMYPSTSSLCPQGTLLADSYSSLHMQHRSHCFQEALQGFQLR